jgi:maltose-binding protein MalE
MKKIVLYIFVFILSLFIFSCNSGNKNKNKIVIWHQMRVDERVILDEHLKRYMELHPEVKVETLYKETETLRSGYIIAAIAGQGPDIVYGPSDQIGPFEVMDIILPLENYFSKEELDQLNPKALTYVSDHLYQIADKLGNHLALVYNKKLISKPPDTDEEMIEIGKSNTKDLNGDGQPDIYGLVWNYTEPFFYIPFLSGFGGWIMDEENQPTLFTDENVNGLNFIKELRDVHKIVPREADYNIADMLFKEGRAAMIINGDWSWSSYQAAGIDIGVYPLPKIQSTGFYCAPMVSPKGFSVNVNVSEEKLPQVIDVIKYLLDAPQQHITAKELNIMPTRIDVLSYPDLIDNDILKNSEEQIEKGKPMPIVSELRAIWDAMRPNYQAVLNGEKTPRQAAKDMQFLSIKKISEMNE